MANVSSNLPPVLQVSQLTKRFRGLLALQDVELTLPPGVIHGVIGPNGAGKTTFFNCLTGQTSATQGQIVFKGHDITRMSAPAIARLGIARTFQNIRLFGGLSVLVWTVCAANLTPVNRHWLTLVAILTQNAKNAALNAFRQH